MTTETTIMAAATTSLVVDLVPIEIDHHHDDIDNGNINLIKHSHTQHDDENDDDIPSMASTTETESTSSSSSSLHQLPPPSLPPRLPILPLSNLG